MTEPALRRPPLPLTRPLRQRQARARLRLAGRESSLLALAIGLCFCALVLYPAVTLLLTPLRDFDEMWTRIMQIPDLGLTFGRTVLLAAGCLALSMTTGAVLAWAASSIADPRLYGIAVFLGVSPVLIPPLAGVVGWAFALSPSIGYVNQLLRSVLPGDATFGPFDAYGAPWIVAIASIYLTPYVFLFLSTALRGLDADGEHAARVCGAGWFTTQRTVVLPRLRPALIYSGLIVVLLGLGQFTAPLLLGRNTGFDVVTTEMFRQTVIPPISYPAAAMIAWPVLIAGLSFVLWNARIIGTHERYAATGKGVGRARVRRSGWLLVPLALYWLLAVLPSLGSLLIVSLSPLWTARPNWGAMSLDGFREILSDQRIVGSVWNTLIYSFGATAICLVLCLALALIVRRSGWLARAVEVCSAVPLAVPSIVFGMGAFLAYALGALDLYGTRTVFLLTYTILFVPHGLRLILSGLAQIGDDVVSAARVSGSTASGATLRVLLPLLKRSMLAAALLMFVLMSHEFGASVLLRTPQTETLTTQLYTAWETGLYPRVAALALLSVVVSALGVLAAVGVGGRDTLEKL